MLSLKLQLDDEKDPKSTTVGFHKNRISQKAKEMLNRGRWLCVEVLNLHWYHKPHYLRFTFKTLPGELFLPTSVQLREIHHCQPVDHKWSEGLKMTDTAKVKKGKVGGDDVESEETEKLGARQWAMVGSYHACEWVGVVRVCVYKRESETERERERDRGSIW